MKLKLNKEENEGWFVDYYQLINIVKIINESSSYEYDSIEMDILLQKLYEMGLIK